MNLLATFIIFGSLVSGNVIHGEHFLMHKSKLPEVKSQEIMKNESVNLSPLQLIYNSIFVAPSQPASNKSSSVPIPWWGWVIIVMLSVISTIAIVYVFIKYMKHQTYLEYSQNPELGIPQSELGFHDRLKLKSWKINDDELLGAKNVKQQSNTNNHGDYIELKFTQIAGTINTIIASQSLLDKEHSYFEVEIDDNPKNSNVMIGFCYDKEYLNTLELGKSITSLAFNSATGIVEYANKELYNYKFTAVYGETLGFGMRWSDGRIWLSHNGKFLNPPPRSEKIKQNDDDEDQYVQPALDEAEKKYDEDLKIRKIVVQNKKPLFPSISSNGPVKINLNIGGQPFRMSQKELRHGLL